MRVIFITIVLFYAYISNTVEDEVKNEIRGHVSCGLYLRALEENYEFGKGNAVGWVMGFISGFNGGMVTYEVMPARKVPDINTVEFALKKYCSENPMNNIYDATLYEIWPNLDLNKN